MQTPKPRRAHFQYRLVRSDENLGYAQSRSKVYRDKEQARRQANRLAANGRLYTMFVSEVGAEWEDPTLEFLDG